MKEFNSPDYLAASESFDTMRMSGWVAEALAASPVENVEIVSPEPLDFEAITAVHDAAYVTAVQSGEPRALAEGQGFTWDPGLWRSVTASTGGVAAAVITAMSDGVAGSLSGGLHHARRGYGSGFCTFNGLAIAAKRALAAGAQSVLIIDVDAHCGGGTHSLIESDTRIRQMDVSVDVFDHYEASGSNTLDMVRDADKYLGTIAGRLSEFDGEERKPDVCLYNSGMDPDSRCSIGGLRGITADILREREELVLQWFKQRGVPIAFVLAGGYKGASLSKKELVKLHLATINIAAA
jgi:acetoin utilization deacetylase AcuC-like enzyme